MFSTLECGSSVVNTYDINEFQLWVWAPFGSHFGGVLGAQTEAKAIKKTLQKTSKKRCPKWAQSGPKGGPKMEPKSSKMTSWKHFVSRVAPEWLPEPLQARCWRGFGSQIASTAPSRLDFGRVLGPFSSTFLIYVQWFLHTLFNNMWQIKTCKITGNPKSFRESASLFVPTSIASFTSER